MGYSGWLQKMTKISEYFFKNEQASVSQTGGFIILFVAEAAEDQ